MHASALAKLLHPEAQLYLPDGVHGPSLHRWHMQAQLPVAVHAVEVKAQTFLGLPGQ